MITGDWIEKIGGFTREQMGKSDDEFRKGYCKMSGKPLRMKKGGKFREKKKMEAV